MEPTQPYLVREEYPWGRTPTYQLPDGTRIRRKFKYALADLLVPETYHYWNCTHFQKLMLVYQWMADTARPYFTYGRAGAFELLCAQPTCRNFSELHAFGRGWKEDLQKRFWYILMSRFASDAAQQWRRDHGINLETELWIHQPWVESDWMFANQERVGEVDRLLKNTEKEVGPQTLRWNLNSSHRERWRTIQRVSLNLWARPYDPKRGEKPSAPPRWAVVLHYGYPQDGSSWQETLAGQRKGEPLLNTLRRAQARLDQLTGTQPAEPWQPAPGYYLESFTREEWDQGGPLQNVVTRYYTNSREAFDYRRMEYGKDVLYFEMAERERERVAAARARNGAWLAEQTFCTGCGFMLDRFSYRNGETECYRCAKEAQAA